MLRTISIGSCISVQGILVAKATDGKMTVRVDDKTFIGYPVSPETQMAHPERPN